MIAVDTSALMAIVLDEPEADAYSAALEAEEAVSPFQDAAAKPLPEEHDVGGFDDLGEEI
jgi:predicted nucleic acid-binding protein